MESKLITLSLMLMLTNIVIPKNLSRKEFYPYLGYLICDTNRTLCMGTLISPMFLLTSAQCYKKGCYEAHLLNDVKKYGVEKVFFPVDYVNVQRKGSSFDVGMVKLNPYVFLSEKVHVIPIAENINLMKCVMLLLEHDEVQVIDLGPKFGRFLECDENLDTSCIGIRTFRPFRGSKRFQLCKHRDRALPLICENALAGLLFTQKCNMDELEENDLLLDLIFKIVTSPQKIVTNISPVELRIINDLAQDDYETSKKSEETMENLSEEKKNIEVVTSYGEILIEPSSLKLNTYVYVTKTTYDDSFGYYKQLDEDCDMRTQNDRDTVIVDKPRGRSKNVNENNGSKYKNSGNRLKFTILLSVYFLMKVIKLH